MTTKPAFQSIDQAFALARKRLPRSIYNRIIGTSVDRSDRLVSENPRVFDDVYWVPRAAAPYDKRELQTTVLGTEISLPVMLACPGASRVFHVDGEPAVAAAADKAGTVNLAAMGHGHTIEEVRAASNGPLWQQVYWSLGRSAVEEIIARTTAANYDALVVTVDMPVLPIGGPAERVTRLVSRKNIKEYATEAVRRPRWTARVLADVYKMRPIPDVEFRPVAFGGAPTRLREGLPFPSHQMGPSWEDLRWLREQWSKPLIVKGIASADDARRALDVGANAIIVSNHGGMALSSTSPSLRKLRTVVEAVDGRCEVYFDSGVRSGADVVKALCLGARAALVGRAYVMGLAVAGEAGVRQVIEILRREIDITLALLGCDSVANLDPSWVEIPSSWNLSR